MSDHPWNTTSAPHVASTTDTEAFLRANRDSWQVRAEEAEEVVGALRADRDRLAARVEELEEKLKERWFEREVRDRLAADLAAMTADRDRWEARANAEWLKHDERAGERISAHVLAADLAEAEKLLPSLISFALAYLPNTERDRIVNAARAFLDRSNQES